MMTAGERYIFFLRPDKGASPHAMGYPRYYPAGGWVGKAKIMNERISFPANAHGQGLTALNGSDAASFLAAVERKIAQIKGANRK